MSRLKPLSYAVELLPVAHKILQTEQTVELKRREFIQITSAAVILSFALPLAADEGQARQPRVMTYGVTELLPSNRGVLK